MRPPDRAAPQFYLAAPRLLAKLRGGSGARTEKNWREANLFGAAVFIVSYAAMARLFISQPSVAKLLAFAVPIAIATWLFWVVAVYVNSLEIRLLRACGLMRQLPDPRAQSLLICLTTTLFAMWLATSAAWASLIGWLWLCATAVNLIAATILRVINARA